MITKKELDAQYRGDLLYFFTIAGFGAAFGIVGTLMAWRDQAEYINKTSLVIPLTEQQRTSLAEFNVRAELTERLAKEIDPHLVPLVEQAGKEQIDRLTKTEPVPAQP